METPMELNTGELTWLSRNIFWLQKAAAEQLHARLATSFTFYINIFTTEAYSL